MEEAGDVEFKIFDISGRVVWSMGKQNQSSGHHTFEWNVENQHNQEVAGGIYFYEIKITTATSRFIEHRKMVISKLRSTEY
jgi:flagellar hook assembly protein FlgD